MSVRGIMGNNYRTGVWVSDQNYDVFDRRLGKSMIDREIKIAEPYRRIGSGAMKNNIKMKRTIGIKYIDNHKTNNTNK